MPSADAAATAPGPPASAEPATARPSLAAALTFLATAERSTAELARIVGYAGIVVLPLALLDRHTWRAAAAGIVAGALLIAVLGTTSRLFPHAFPKDLVTASFKGQRLNYPFHYWNAV